MRSFDLPLLKKIYQSLAKLPPSGLSRPALLLQDPTGQKVLLACAGVFFAYTLQVLLQTPQPSVGGALASGFSRSLLFVFSYVSAIELQPDERRASVYGLPLLAVALFFFPEVSALPALYILLCLRIVTRSAGRSLQFIDLVVFGFLSALLYFRGDFLFPLFGGVFLLADFRMPGSRLRSLALAGPLLALPTLSFFNLYSIAPVHAPSWMLLVPSLLAPAFAFRISYIRRILSQDDTGHFISPRRVQLAGMLCLVMLVSLCAVSGLLIPCLGVYSAMLGLCLPMLGTIRHGRSDAS